MNKRGLGRGLGALLGEDARPEAEVKTQGAVQMVDVNMIDRFENQPRKSFDEEKLKELAQSIKTHGIVSPIIVNKAGDRYMIIAGERRYRAARLAGFSEVPVLVKEMTDREHMELSIIENLQREDLNAIEEAQAYRMLMDEYSLTQEEVSQRISKSRSAIANTLRLLTLPDQVQDMVAQGRLSAGHARCLVSIEDNAAKVRLADLIVTKGVSVRETERLAAQINNPRPRAKGAKPRRHFDRDIASVEEQLSQKLETKVQLQGTFKKGKLVIEYYSYDQLQALFEYMTNR